jgi:cytochrome c551/c552
MNYFFLFMAFLFTSCMAENHSQENIIKKNEKPKKEDKAYKLGEEIFNNQCKSCHLIDKVFIGPSLGGITQRRSKKWIKDFIRNPAALIKKDFYAREVFEKYNRLIMPCYEFSDKEMEALLMYIEQSYEAIQQKK